MPQKMWFGLNLVALSSLLLICRMSCLSLDEIHSSSNQFKSISHQNKDNSLKNAIETIHRRRQENPFAHLYGPNSLPLQAIQYYQRLVPFDETQDIEVPLEYQIEDNYSDESLKPEEDLYLKALALKLAQLSESNSERESDVSHRILNRISLKKKRSTSKQSSLKTKVKNLDKIKQNVKNTNKNALIKPKTKRNSGRRVLSDHYNVEENKKNVIKPNTNLKSPKMLPNSQILLSKSNQKLKNQNRKQTKAKKMIRKRRAESQMALDKRAVNNESKTNSPELKTTDKSVVSELNDILSDDSKAEKIIETKQNKTNNNNINKSLSQGINLKNTKTKLIKAKNKRSSPSMEQPLSDDSIDDNNNNNENIITYPIENIEEKSELRISETPDKYNQQMDEWLRREYYENIAKALATMRRKRSEEEFDFNPNNDENDGINAIEDSDFIADNLIANDISNENNGDEKIDNVLDRNMDKLSDDSDDDYVVAAIDDDIDGNDNNTQDINDGKDREEGDNENDDSVLWDIIEEKNSKQMVKRSVNSGSEEESDNEETNEIDIDSQRFSRINTKLESIEDSLLSEAIGLIRETAQKGSQSEAESNKIENRLNAAYNIEDMRTILDDLHKTVDKINVENDRNNDLIETANREVATDLIDNNIDYQNTNDFVNSLSKSESVNNCFAIEMFSSDCSSVADLMPNSRLRESFTEACNWHHICYTCGEVYGLLSSDCDSGFLEASRLACNDSPSCETFSRLVLTPLRQSRVFYKSSVPKTCFQYQCIKDYLFDSQNNKR